MVADYRTASQIVFDGGGQALQGGSCTVVSNEGSVNADLAPSAPVRLARLARLAFHKDGCFAREEINRYTPLTLCGLCDGMDPAKRAVSG